MSDKLITLYYSRTWACRRLRAIMGDVSEAAHCASWFQGTEEDLPPMLVKSARAESDDAAAEVIGEGWAGFGCWGSVELAQEAVMLAAALGHWVNNEGHPYKPKSMDVQ